ncbi:MarR family winged helix-turn-helix transcriptional regulator [Poseidonocella sp. HB161398]|uniref:MarR family winged helix-turn-helix transcriptional regulator n=1 Tax=Poseidonocella sp. HB161398 TaxID=2320855 RepID=UPI0011096BEB|nr:MarR family transcriptional regulator [Poseidonocella sp. HB161398]
MPRPGKREDLGLQLITVSRRYRRIMDGVFAGHGLSYASTLPLRFLARQDRPYRQKELAGVLDIEGPTLVRVLDTLVAQGFVRRSEDPADRRAKLVSVTAEGHAFLGLLAGRLGELRDEIFAGVPEEEIDAALRLLSRLDANMDPLGPQD